MVLNEFAQHALVFGATLAVVVVGAVLKAPSELIAPLSQGLGVALPVMLGAHGIAKGVAAWPTGAPPDQPGAPQ